MSTITETPQTGAADSQAELDVDATRATIEWYEDLRQRCYAAAMRDNAALMGKDANLKSYWSEKDIQMSPNEFGIYCEGSFYCSTTRDIEFFGFQIPWSAL